MKTPVNLLRTFLCVTLLLSVSQEKSDGALVLSLTDGVDLVNSGTVSQGASFTLLSSVVSEDSFVAISYAFEISGAGSGFFTLTARDITGAPYTAANYQTDQATLFNGANNQLDPVTADLGFFGVSPTITPGTYSLASFTILASPLTPTGTYTISFFGTSASGPAPDFDELIVNSNSYTITVVPEPTSNLLLLGGIGSLLALSRRRRVFRPGF